MADVSKTDTYDQYTGATKDEPENLEMGTRSKGSYLTQLSPDEQRLWDNLFRYFESMRPMIAYLAEMDGKEIPPAFINEPWHYVSDDVAYTWPNYSAMHEAYREAGLELISEYERLKSEAENLGIPPLMFGLLGIMVAVGGAVLMKFGGELVESFKKDAVTLRIEAETDRIATYNRAAADFAARGQDLNKHLEQVYRHDKIVAEDAGMSWPFVIKQASSVLKWLIVGGIALIGWDIIKGKK